MRKISNFKFQISNCKSFTLAEILITIAILVILIGIGIPAFRSFQPTLQLSGSVRNLVSDLRYAQQLAVTEQVVHGIYFTPAEKKYEIIKYGAATSSVKSVSLPPEITTITLGQEFINNNNTVKYNPYGATDVSGLITLGNLNNSSTTIEIKPSGFVKITD